MARTAPVGVAVPDQRLADQHRASALADEPGDVVGSADPRLGDQHPVVGDEGREPAEGVVVDREGLEVAGVDADELGAEGDRALGLGLVVDLDEHGQPELARLVVQAAQVVVVERGHDQQDEVGAGRAGLDELVAR